MPRDVQGLGVKAAACAEASINGGPMLLTCGEGSVITGVVSAVIGQEGKMGVCGAYNQSGYVP